MAMARTVFFLALLLLAASFLQVARSQPTAQDEGADDTEDSSNLEIVNGDEEASGFPDENFSPAKGVDTICVFPKNIGKLVLAGEETELLVGVKYDGESNVNVIAIKASVHYPSDHRVLVQNLTAQVFNNASLPPSAQATFPYVFAVSKLLPAGSFDLVGTIIYEIDQQPYRSTFYNGTIEVAEPSGFLSFETAFLAVLAFGVLVVLILWVRGLFQGLSKKSKKAPKVEVGTRSTDASLDEWLEGTAYTLSNKSKKKK